MIKGFRDFILRGNVIDLAIAVVIGAALTGIITQLTKSFIQQAAEEARRLGRFGGCGGFQFCFGLGFLLTLFGGEPFVQAHACLGGALGFVGALALGERLG